MIIVFDGQAYLEWKLGTPFDWEHIDAKLEANASFEYGAVAEVGLRGSVVGSYAMEIE